MRKITFILFALISGTSFAQLGTNGSFTATADVNADIVSPLELAAAGEALDFGRIANTTAGTVIISADGERSGSASFIESSAFSPASFTMNAADGYTFTISIPDTNLTNEDGTTTLAVTAFEHNLSSLEGTGQDVEFNVGGTLTVGETAPDGNYSGEVTVTIAYQ